MWGLFFAGDDAGLLIFLEPGFFEPVVQVALGRSRASDRRRVHWPCQHHGVNSTEGSRPGRRRLQYLEGSGDGAGGRVFGVMQGLASEWRLR